MTQFTGCFQICNKIIPEDTLSKTISMHMERPKLCSTYFGSVCDSDEPAYIDVFVLWTLKKRTLLGAQQSFTADQWWDGVAFGSNAKVPTTHPSSMVWPDPGNIWATGLYTRMSECVCEHANLVTQLPPLMAESALILSSLRLYCLVTPSEKGQWSLWYNKIICVSNQRCQMDLAEVIQHASLCLKSFLFHKCYWYKK